MVEGDRSGTVVPDSEVQEGSVASSVPQPPYTDLKILLSSPLSSPLSPDMPST